MSFHAGMRSGLLLLLVITALPVRIGAQEPESTVALCRWISWSSIRLDQHTFQSLWGSESAAFGIVEDHLLLQRPSMLARVDSGDTCQDWPMTRCACLLFSANRTDTIAIGQEYLLQVNHRRFFDEQDLASSLYRAISDSSEQSHVPYQSAVAQDHHPLVAACRWIFWNDAMAPTVWPADLWMARTVTSKTYYDAATPYAYSRRVFSGAITAPGILERLDSVVAQDGGVSIVDPPEARCSCILYSTDRTDTLTFGARVVMQVGMRELPLNIDLARAVYRQLYLEWLGPRADEIEPSRMAPRIFAP